MREIKFRAWNPEEKEMIYNEFHICSDGSIYSFGPTPQFILMQYTGLKDKNGKEIYEGDIVRAWIDMGPAGEQPMTHAVVIDAWGCGLQEWTYKESRFLPEVIGNIYENPDLLKEGEPR